MIDGLRLTIDDLGMACDVHFDVGVGFEGVGDVGLAGGEDEGGVQAVGELSGVVGDDLGGDAVEVVEELVGEDGFGAAGQGEGELESVELAVGQLRWGAQEQKCVGEAGEGEVVEGFFEGEVEVVGKDFVFVGADAVEVGGGSDQAGEDVQEGGFSAAGLAGDEDDAARGDGEVEVVEDGESLVAGGVEGDAESGGNPQGGGGCREGRGEIGSDTQSVHDVGISR